MTTPSESNGDSDRQSLTGRLVEEPPSWAVGGKRLIEIAARQRAPEILDIVCRYVEALSAGCHCGIYLSDGSAAGAPAWVSPSLPAGLNAAICALALNDDAVARGNSARLSPQMITADQELDPSLQETPYRALAIAHGIKAYWSMPIVAMAGDFLGNVVVLENKLEPPTPLQQDLVADVAYLVGIAIERARAEADVDKARSELALVTGILEYGASLTADLVEALSGIVINASTCSRMLSVVPSNVDGARETVRRTMRDTSRASNTITLLRNLLDSRRDARSMATVSVF